MHALDILNKINSEQKKIWHFTKCGSANARLSLRRYGWRIFDNFSEEFLLFMSSRERMDFNVDDSLIQTLSLCFVCAKLQFNPLYGNVCACLHWLNRISFAPVNCHNWSNNKKKHMRYFSGAFCFAGGDSWFFLRRPHRKLYAVIIYISIWNISYRAHFPLCLLFCHFS